MHIYNKTNDAIVIYQLGGSVGEGQLLVSKTLSNMFAMRICEFDVTHSWPYNELWVQLPGQTDSTQTFILLGSANE